MAGHGGVLPVIREVCTGKAMKQATTGVDSRLLRGQWCAKAWGLVCECASVQGNSRRTAKSSTKLYIGCVVI